MLKKIILVTALSFAIAPAAFAGDACIDTMKSVETAVAAETVAVDVKEKAGDLLSQAKEKQAAGDNKACVTLLTEATKLLTSE